MDQVEQYKRNFPIQDAFTNKLYSLICEFLASSGIVFHLIDKRTKTIDSFKDKVEKDKSNNSEIQKEYTDYSGIRIILYYTDDIPRIVEILEREFEVDKTNSNYNLEVKNPNEFGYSSTHLIVSLKSPRHDLSEWAMVKGLKAEIQIRTVLQHAWSAISHQLQYKTQYAVPHDLQRQLSRLAGLFEIGDEQFLSLRVKHQKLAYDVNNINESDLFESSIDILTVGKFINESTLVKKLYDLALQIGYEDMSSYPDEDIDQPIVKNNLMELIALCDHIGIKYIKEINSTLEGFQADAELALKMLWEKNAKGNEGYSWFISKPFLVQLILVFNYYFIIDNDFLNTTGWHPKTLANLIEARESYDKSIKNGSK